MRRALFLHESLCGWDIAEPRLFLEICGEVKPTVISAGNASYYAIYKELLGLYRKYPITSFLLRPIRHVLRNTPYFKYVRQQRVSELLGDNLRLCLSFYSFRPLSKAGHTLL